MDFHCIFQKVENIKIFSQMSIKINKESINI